MAKKKLNAKHDGLTGLGLKALGMTAKLGHAALLVWFMAVIGLVGAAFQIPITLLKEFFQALINMELWDLARVPVQAGAAIVLFMAATALWVVMFPLSIIFTFKHGFTSPRKAMNNKSFI